MKIAIYSRKSKFTGKGESIDNQIQMCKEYAERQIQGHKEFIVYEDEGFSGGNTNRPEFQRLLLDIKNKKVNVLMCYRLDRISRNVADFSDTIKTLENNDVQFVSIKEQFDTSTPIGKAMLHISSVFAQLERDTIAERIKDNMYELAKTGRWLGGPAPYGYDSKKIITGDRSQFVLIDNEEEQEIMKLFFRKYKEFGNLTKLENWIGGNGYDNERVSFKNINRMFASPVYAMPDEDMYNWFVSQKSNVCVSKEEFLSSTGITSYGKQHSNGKSRGYFKPPSGWTISAVNTHTGVVSGLDWISNYNMMRGNKSNPRQHSGKVGMLVPVLKCKCGANMNIMYAKTKTKFYYKCGRKIKNIGLCQSKNLNGLKTDQEIINILKDIKVNKNKIPTLGKQNDTGNLEKEKKKLKGQIDSLTKQLSQNPTSSASKYIIKSIEDLDNRISKINNQLLNNTANKKNANDLIKTVNVFLDSFDSLELPEKKRILQMIFKRIVWDGDALHVEFLM